MAFVFEWLLIIIVLNLCTCGGKTECVDRSKLAVIANLQSKKCNNNMNNHFYLKGVDDNLSEKYNFDYEGWRLEILFLDSCGNNEETLKAIFQTIMWADINCLKPPYFLGFIGPEKLDNLNVSQKITSALDIPHIVTIESKSRNSYQILQPSNLLIIKGIFKLLDTFGWKSFFLWSNLENKVIRSIAQQFTMEASTRKYCFLTNRDTATNFIILGKPQEDFFNHLTNSSIIILDDENLEIFISNYNSTNHFLVLDNLNINFKDGHIQRNEPWFRKSMPILNEKNELLFVPDAIKIYINAMNILCKSKNCNIHEDVKRWNQMIMDTIATYNKEQTKEKQFLTFKVKEKFEQIKSMGKITYSDNDLQVYWNNQLLSLSNHITESSSLKNFFITSVLESNCAQNILNINTINKESIDADKTATVIISELSESEWWTMVGTVAGVGIAMFTVGFFAVYIVYTNIRGSRTTKGSGREDLDRDSSLRRVGSDRQISSNVGRSSRVTGALQRRDSRNSIRSNISDKSV